MRVRFWPDESMQGAAIVEVVLDEGRRHPLGTYDGRTGWSEVEGDCGNANGHCPHMPVYLPIAKSLYPTPLRIARSVGVPAPPPSATPRIQQTVLSCANTLPGTPAEPSRSELQLGSFEIVLTSIFVQ